VRIAHYESYQGLLVERPQEVTDAVRAEKVGEEQLSLTTP